MQCKHCKSPDTVLARVNKHSITKAYCKACRQYFTAWDVPKILLFDIETSRIKVEFDLFAGQLHKKTRLSHESVTQDWFIISWAGKWLFDDEVFGAVLKPSEAKKRDDRRIAQSLHKIVKEADFIIAHNGDAFDVKSMNWRFIMHGFEPVVRYQSIDTLKKSRQIFKAPSHAMDYLCRMLGYNGKHETDRKLWEQCEAGDSQALQRMYEYNKNDIWMLEDLYLRLRGWMRTHPNFAVYTEMYHTLKRDENQCPRCLEVVHDSKFTKRITTPAGYKYAVCSCPHCGAMLRKTHRDSGQMVMVR